jgi:hypothetical protein
MRTTTAKPAIASTEMREESFNAVEACGSRTAQKAAALGSDSVTFVFEIRG